MVIGSVPVVDTTDKIISDEEIEVEEITPEIVVTIAEQKEPEEEVVVSVEEPETKEIETDTQEKETEQAETKEEPEQEKPQRQRRQPSRETPEPTPKSEPQPDPEPVEVVIVEPEPEPEPEPIVEIVVQEPEPEPIQTITIVPEPDPVYVPPADPEPVASASTQASQQGVSEEEPDQLEKVDKYQFRNGVATETTDYKKVKPVGSTFTVEVDAVVNKDDGTYGVGGVTIDFILIRPDGTQESPVTATTGSEKGGGYGRASYTTPPLQQEGIYTVIARTTNGVETSFSLQVIGLPDAIMIGETGSFSAYISGQRLYGHAEATILGNVQAGDPVPNTSLPSSPHDAAVAAGSLKGDDGTYQQHTFSALFTLNININGWVWQANPHEISFDSVQFDNIDATVGETLFIIHSPNNNVIPGGYTVFTYLARHYLQRENGQDKEREIMLGAGIFKKDLGNGRTAIMKIDSMTIQITGGSDNTLNYKITSVASNGAVTYKE